MQQLSVFLENRPGELIALTKTLSEAKISIDSITIAETSNFGVVRIITKDIECAITSLKDAGFSARIVKVVAVMIDNKIGAFHNIVEILNNQNININYCYSFYSSDDKGIFIFSVDNYELAKESLQKADFKIISPK